MKHETIALACAIIFVGFVLAINFADDNARGCARYPEFCFEWMNGVAE